MAEHSDDSSKAIIDEVFHKYSQMVGAHEHYVDGGNFDGVSYDRNIGRETAFDAVKEIVDYFDLDAPLDEKQWKKFEDTHF